MQFTAIILGVFVATAFTTPTESPNGMAIFNRQVNAGRPVATGACCIEATSKKQDVCTKDDGTAGKCAPANTAGCEYNPLFGEVLC
jgi:hypothetical protein